MNFSVMTTADLAECLKDSLAEELHERLLPYWMAMQDVARGGFVGRVTGSNEIIPEAPRGGIVNARLLWTFASAARVTGSDAYSQIAHASWQYFADHFLDPVHGGVYWMLSADGQVIDDRKHVYAQAFGIYALAEYARFSGSIEALSQAKDLFDLIEKYSYQSISPGYEECFSREWKLFDDPRLSEKDEFWPRSTNAMLHILEAYTGLYLVWNSSIVRSRLIELINIFLTRIVWKDGCHMHGFFDTSWIPRSNFISYGHDIEGAWLLREAARAIGDDHLIERVEEVALSLINTVRTCGIAPNGGLVYQKRSDGTTDTDHHWWPQAEAIVGLFDAFEMTKDPVYLKDALRVWRFVRSVLQESDSLEWHFRVDALGRPYRQEDKVGPWKGPYHNARACLQIIERMEKESVY